MSNITTASRPVYITSDGQEFTDSNIAEGHQAALDNKDLITTFISEMHPDKKDRYKLTLAAVLLSWEQFKASQKMVQAPKVEAAKSA